MKKEFIRLIELILTQAKIQKKREEYNVHVTIKIEELSTIKNVDQFLSKLVKDHQILIIDDFALILASAFPSERKHINNRLIADSILRYSDAEKGLLYDSKNIDIEIISLENLKDLLKTEKNKQGFKKAVIAPFDMHKYDIEMNSHTFDLKINKHLIIFTDIKDSKTRSAVIALWILLKDPTGYKDRVGFGKRHFDLGKGRMKKSRKPSNWPRYVNNILSSTRKFLRDNKSKCDIPTFSHEIRLSLRSSS